MLQHPPGGGRKQERQEAVAEGKRSGVSVVRQAGRWVGAHCNQPAHCKQAERQAHQAAAPPAACLGQVLRAPEHIQDVDMLFDGSEVPHNWPPQDLLHFGVVDCTQGRVGKRWVGESVEGWAGERGWGGNWCGKGGGQGSGHTNSKKTQQHAILPSSFERASGAAAHCSYVLDFRLC